MGVAANEARALRARLHMALVSQNAFFWTVKGCLGSRVAFIQLPYMYIQMGQG